MHQMTFTNTPTLITEDSDIDTDLEVSTMTKFYEIEKIFQKMEKSDEDRKLWLEMLIYKLGEVFQNCMKSYEYLEKPDLRKSFLDRSSKERSLEFLKESRGAMYHKSKSVLDKTIHSNFMQIDGEYFKGIHVRKGGNLIVGEHQFDANDSEFAFTTEGIFEIKNPDSEDELWEKLEYPSITTFDDSDIIRKLVECHGILRTEFFKIRTILKRGDGKYEHRFKTKGNIKLFVTSKEQSKVYDLNGQSLDVRGTLSISPMNFELDLQARQIKRT